jgi:transposase
MTQSRTLYVDLDVHKDALAVASAAKDDGAAVVSLGHIGTRQRAIEQLVRRLHAQSPQLVLVSEAGPCGDWLSRSVTTKGHGCWRGAPALLPKQAGDRVTTNRRDALKLARLRRSGDLPPVSVPAVEEEAMRDLCRARAETLHALQAAKLRRKALLLRHALRSTGHAPWGPAPLRWLSKVVCPTAAQPIVLQASVHAVTAYTARLERLEQALHDHVQTWRLAPVVDALQGLRGVQGTVAVTTVAARGDLTRFENPRQLMRYLGLTPSAYARGERRRQGGLTKTGNAQARRALMEGAWASRSPAKGSRHLPRRLAKLPTPIPALSWQAQVRLGQRSRRLIARGKHAHQVVVAIARA